MTARVLIFLRLFNQYNCTVCQVIDYYFARKMLVSSPLYKAFQPCSENPTGIPAALHRSGPSLDLGRDRRPRMSLPYPTLSCSAAFLYVCYSKIIRSKPPVYKFMLGTFARVKSSGNTRRKCYRALSELLLSLRETNYRVKKRFIQIVVNNSEIIDIIKHIILHRLT